MILNPDDRFTAEHHARFTLEGEGRQRAFCELPGWGDSASPPPGSRSSNARRPPPSRGRSENAAAPSANRSSGFSMTPQESTVLDWLAAQRPAMRALLETRVNTDRGICHKAGGDG